MEKLDFLELETVLLEVRDMEVCYSSKGKVEYKNQATLLKFVF